jgi:hypothetical protein
LPIRCFDHLFTVRAPAAVIESVHPTSQYAYVQHMHGVRHGEPVPTRPANRSAPSCSRGDGRGRPWERWTPSSSRRTGALRGHGGAHRAAVPVGSASPAALRSRYSLRLRGAALSAGGVQDRWTASTHAEFHAHRPAAQLRRTDHQAKTLAEPRQPGAHREPGALVDAWKRCGCCAGDPPSSSAWAGETNRRRAALRTSLYVCDLRERC